MKVCSRYYLACEDSLFHLSKDVMESRVPLPKLAGTHQKYVQVIFEWREDILFSNETGHYVSFNADGFAEFSTAALADGMHLNDVERRNKKASVADLREIRLAREKMAAHRWDVSDGQRESIVASLLPSAYLGRRHIKSAKSVFGYESKAA